LAAHHTTQSPTQIAEWITEAQAGAAEALDKLMEFSRQYLLLIANDELPTDLQAKAGASDLVQQTQMEAAQAFEQFNGHTVAELLAWLRQILLHNVGDLKRRYTGADKRLALRERSLDAAASSRDLTEEFVEDFSSPSSHLRRTEQTERVAAAIAQLPADYRQVILWRHRENCSFEEISERLGRSVGAARKLWARAVRELQERLKAAHESKS
jgi:RNA polymerase sigma-70 factor, ECF subfamily